MGQLIQKLEGPIPLHKAQQKLNEARQQLVACGQTAVMELKHLTPAEWGSAAKQCVALPQPALNNQLMDPPTEG